MQQIETAFDRMVRSDIKYRFVIDMHSLQEAQERSDATTTETYQAATA